MTDSDDRPVDPTAMATHIAAAPEVVFGHLTTPDGLTAWWPTRAEIDARVGGSYHFHFAGPGVDLRGEIVEFDSPHRLVYTWSWDHEQLPPSTVTFELSDDAGTTRLGLVHTASSPEEADDHRSGWDFFLGRLAQAIEGGT